MGLRHAVFTALVLSSLPALARATIVTFDFKGEVTGIYNPHGLVGPPIAVGSPVMVSLRYDTSTADRYPEDPTRGTYLDTPGFLKADISGQRFESTTRIQLDVLHGFGGQELFQVLAIGSPNAWPASLPQFTFPEIAMSAVETGPPHDLLISDALPTSIDFSHADQTTGFVRAATRDENMYEIQFSLRQVPTIPPQPVSEPGTALLLVGAFAGLLLRALSREG